MEPAATTNAKTGLPEIDEGTRAKFSTLSGLGAFIFPAVSTAIGYGLAYLIYTYGDTSKYDSRRDICKSYDLEWLLLSLIIFALIVVWINMYPMRFKERFMGRKGNLRANMFIYKLATDQSGEGSAVVLNEDGDIGCYNRGNRSVHHFLENSLPFVGAMPITFFLYPIPAFVLLCLFCFGRVIH